MEEGIMSDYESREQRAKRFQNDETHIKKRQKLIKAKSAYWPNHTLESQPHRLHKCSGMNCGNSHCVMCGNPRKFFHERTVQEQSFEQDRLWSEE